MQLTNAKNLIYLTLFIPPIHACDGGNDNVDTTLDVSVTKSSSIIQTSFSANGTLKVYVNRQAAVTTDKGSSPIIPVCKLGPINNYSTLLGSCELG